MRTRIQPRSVTVVIIVAYAHHEHSAAGRDRVLQASYICESGNFTKRLLEISAVVVRDGLVGAEGGHAGLGRRNNVAEGYRYVVVVLLVEATDLHDVAVVLAGVGDELSSDGKFMVCVNRAPGTEERRVAEAICVELAAIFIAGVLVSVRVVVSFSAFDLVLAAVLIGRAARMSRANRGIRISLEYVHLLTAASIPPFTIGFGVGGPPKDIALIGDERSS